MWRNIQLWKVAIVFIFALGAHEARAGCALEKNAPSTFFADFPNAVLSPPPNVQVGDVLYDKTIAFNIVFAPAVPLLTCTSAGENRLFFNRGTCATDVCVTKNPSIGTKVTITGLGGFTDLITSKVFTLPRGDLKDPIPVQARLQYIVLSLPLGTQAPVEAFREDTPAALSTQPKEYGYQGFLLRIKSAKMVATSCSIDAPTTVDLQAAGIQDFSAVGSVAKATNFNIKLHCSGESQVSRIGVGFGRANQHATASPGVIATDQGDGMASGTALQIVNRTTSQPIKFETLERGPDTLTTNGTYNYPFLVQYFKTAAVMTPGAVRGRVVVNVEMQ